MNLVHLTASTFFGGPERQMLGLALAMSDSARTTFATFPEGGRGSAFLTEVRQHGFATAPLKNDFPKVFATAHEVSELIRATACDVLICHGYKAHILGRLAARRTGIPAIAVSRGWTGENRKVKLYEWLDRRHLRFMDHVICVSEGQAAKVQKWSGVPANRMSVIRNSARLNAFEKQDPTARQRLQTFFPEDQTVTQIILGAGRFSPEKGFGVLVEAAATICRDNPNAGIVIFGEGSLRSEMEQRIAQLNLRGRIILPGFRSDLDSLIGAADVVVLPSYTEGLPNVALEASAAGVPVVATAVGGTPEVIADGVTGLLIPPGDPTAIATSVNAFLRDSAKRNQFGVAGRQRMHELFTFDAQAAAYLQLLRTFCPTPTELVA